MIKEAGLAAINKGAGIAGIFKQGYGWIFATASGLLACYTDIDLALYLFLAATVLDTFSAINAQAVAKGLTFNPFKMYFWMEIKSKGLRSWAKKLFGEYTIYIILAFMLDKWVLKSMIVIDVHHWQLTLPVAVIYFLAFIEIWSIGENIEKTGRPNYIKKLVNWMMPEKFKKFIPGNEDKVNETPE